MQAGEESIKETMERILGEMRRMQSYYHSLLFCGTAVSLFLFLGAFAFIGSWWGRSVTVWLSLSILAGSAWVYLKAYRQLKYEICFYKDMLGIQIEKKRLPVIEGFNYMWRLASNLYFLCFITGFLLSLLFVDHLQDKYENSLFSTLSWKVAGHSRSMPEDSIFIRSMTLSHDLLIERSAIYNNDIEASWMSTYIHPLSLDLITANGACGSYSVVLCRILQGLSYKTRLLQMKGEDGKVCHIILEVLSSRGWVVLDPLYNLYFKRPDGHLASFDDVSRNWDYYHTQAPTNYNSRYNYAGAQYTNWNKIPVVLPILKKMLGIFMDKVRLEHFSLRVYFLRKYKVLEYITLIIFIVAFSRLMTKTIKIWNSRRNRKPAGVKRWLRKIPAFGVNWPNRWVS